MNAAFLLLALIAAGQAGWTPERTSSPPARTTDNDRYAQPPATSNPGSPSNVTSPFGSSNSALTRPRGGVAPPPWDTPAAMTPPDWDSMAMAAEADSSPAVRPLRSADGWTSIGGSVVAPPMLVPALTRSPAGPATVSQIPAGGRSPSLSMPALNNPPDNRSSAESARTGAPSASAADSWASGWGDAPSTPQATISRAGARESDRAAFNFDSRPAPETPVATPPKAQPPANNSWANLWGDADPWADTSQTPVIPPAEQPAGQPGPQQAAAAAPPPATTPTGPALGTPPPATTPTTARATAATSGNEQPLPNVTTRQPAMSPQQTADEPWLPLLIVSVSLAGSLGANLFLGWSYLDARQKYQTLVRKTAEKFRLAVTTAA